MTDQRSRLENILSHIEYKPGWSFHVRPNPSSREFGCFDDILFIIFYETFDSNLISQEERIAHRIRNRIAAAIGKPNPEVGRYRYNRVLSSSDLERYPDDVVINLIANIIKQVEIGEFERWFRMKGTYAPSPDPHPQLPRTNQEVRG